MSDLKPCAHCGASHSFTAPPDCEDVGDFSPGDEIRCRVICLPCGVTAFGNQWDYGCLSAVEAWNRRHQEQDPSSTFERWVNK